MLTTYEGWLYGGKPRFVPLDYHKPQNVARFFDCFVYYFFVTKNKLYIVVSELLHTGLGGVAADYGQCFYITAAAAGSLDTRERVW